MSRAVAAEPTSASSATLTTRAQDVTNLLARAVRGSASTLIVPVDAANDVRHRSARAHGMPAHITILYPFASPRELDRRARERLAAAIEEVRAFDFALHALRRFPTAAYLAPEPAEPFIALTQAVVREWPQYEPYGGAFDEIVPHLTVACGEATPVGVHDRVPVNARADEVWLMARTLNRWVRRRRFKLGAPADKLLR